MSPLFAVLTLAQGGLSAPVEVPFKIAEEAMIVDAVVNGRKASFLFDTGFSGSIVLGDNVEIGPATGTVNLRDFVGEFQAKTVKVKTLQLGALKIDPEERHVVQLRMGSLTESYNAHTDGIMGLEVVKEYVTEINFQKQRFIFHPKGTDISKRVPDNKRTFMGKLLPIGNTSLVMQVKIPSTGRSMVMALDTGNAFYATTHKDVLDRVGLWPITKKPSYAKLASIASGTVDSWELKMPKTEIFGVPVEESIWDVIDLPASSADHDGTIGFGFLKNFNITIDLESRRVWLENYTGKVANEPAATTGISAMYSPRLKRVVVLRVTPGSPAAQAGVKERDEILSVDDEELHTATFKKMEQMMHGPVGSKVRLAVSRNGQLMRFEVDRAVLVNTLN